MTVNLGNFRKLTGGPGMRLAGIGLLTLLLLIPLALINERVQERSQRHDAAAAEVAHSWGGGRQVVAGPFLRVPYSEHVIEDGKELVRTGWLVVPPESLTIDAALDSETRHRGIFEVPVFHSKLALYGHFRLEDDEPLPANAASPDWSRAEVMVAITEPRSIGADAKLVWNGRAASLKPAAPGLSGQGVHARVPTQPSGEGGRDLGEFRLDLELNGAESLQFAPAGRSTRARIVSDWPHPSFQGDWLPAKSEIGAQGFDASWTVSHLGRGYPALWVEGEVTADQVLGSTFGVDFNVPVDTYRMGERIAKYGVLLVLLGFATVWVMELLGGRPMHPVQILLLGASLCLFGLLQLALAEHIGFAPAYVLAAAAIVGQASLFLRTATGSSTRAGVLAVILSGWFAWLYVVVNAEDSAFLLGALALFGALSGVMWATRRVDWGGGGKWDVATATIEN